MQTSRCMYAWGWAFALGFFPAVAQRPPHFTKQVPLVNLTLVATGANGKPYLGLQPSQLVIRENGHRQKLIGFRPAWLPAPASASPAASGLTAALKTRSAWPPAAASANLRYIALAVDEMALSPLERTHLISSLRNFFAQPSTQPVAFAIFAFRHGLKLVQTFTDDPATLRAALDKLARDPLSPSRHQTVDNLLQDLNDCRCLTGNAELNDGVRGSAPTGNLFAIMRSSAPQDSLKAAHRCGFLIAHSFRGQQEQLSQLELDDMRALIALLGVIPGEKQVIYLGHGFLLNPGDLAYRAYTSYFDAQPMYAGQLEHQLSMRELAAAAQADDVTVDALDLHSLRADSLSGNTGGNFGHAGAGQSHAAGDAGPGQGAIAAMNFLMVRDRATGNALRQMAALTGGRAYLDRNHWQPGLRQATSNLAGIYYAAYIPADRKLDGSYRRISLQFLPPAGVHGVSVQTRPGYFARPWHRLPLRFHVDPPANYQGKLMIAVRCSLPAKSLHWHQRQGQRYDQLVAMSRVLNASGQVVHRQFYAWPVEPGKDGRVHFGFGLFLPPGKYYYLVRIQEPGARRLAELSTRLSIK